MKNILLAILIVLVIAGIAYHKEVNKYWNGVMSDIGFNKAENEFGNKTTPESDNQVNSPEKRNISEKMNGNKIRFYLYDEEKDPYWSVVHYSVELVYYINDQGKEEAMVCSTCLADLDYKNENNEDVNFKLDPETDIIVAVGYGFIPDAWFSCNDSETVDICANAYRKMEYWRGIIQWHKRIDKMLKNYKQHKDRL